MFSSAQIIFESSFLFITPFVLFNNTITKCTSTMIDLVIVLKEADTDQVTFNKKITQRETANEDTSIELLILLPNIQQDQILTVESLSKFQENMSEFEVSIRPQKISKLSIVFILDRQSQAIRHQKKDIFRSIMSLLSSTQRFIQKLSLSCDIGADCLSSAIRQSEIHFITVFNWYSFENTGQQIKMLIKCPLNYIQQFHILGYFDKYCIKELSKIQWPRLKKLKITNGHTIENSLNYFRKMHRKQEIQLTLDMRQAPLFKHRAIFPLFNFKALDICYIGLGEYSHIFVNNVAKNCELRTELEQLQSMNINLNQAQTVRCIYHRICNARICYTQI